MHRPPERATVPLAEGGRVHLRRACLDDAAGLFDAYAADPAATRFLSWPPRRTVDEVARWLAPTMDGWDDGSCWRWVLAASPDDAAFGTVVLTAQAPGRWRLGYALGIVWSGRGVATAAVRTVLSWLDGEVRDAVVDARTDPDHSASIAVLRNCGFELERIERASWTRPTLGPSPRDALCFRWSAGG